MEHNYVGSIITFIASLYSGKCDVLCTVYDYVLIWLLSYCLFLCEAPKKWNG